MEVLTVFTGLSFLTSVRVLSDEVIADFPWVDIAFLLSITNSLLDKVVEEFLFT